MKDEEEEVKEEITNPLYNKELAEAINALKSDIRDYYPRKTWIYKRLIYAFPHKEHAICIFTMGLLYLCFFLSYAIIWLIVEWWRLGG